MSIIIICSVLVLTILASIAVIISPPNLEPYTYDSDVHKSTKILEDICLEIERGFKEEGLPGEVIVTRYNDAIALEIHIPYSFDSNDLDTIEFEKGQILAESLTVLNGSPCDVVLQIFNVNNKLVYQAD